jgi:hypothetical protein
MRLRRRVVLTSLLTLLGCVEPRILRPSIPFDSAAEIQALQPGKGTITGQAFKKTVGGDVKYAAGNTVTLYPVTPYFREVLALWPQRNPPSVEVVVDSSVFNFKKTTVADGEGRFSFTDLAPGEYYVETMITWGIPTGHGIETTGGNAFATATVMDGKNTPLILQ